MRNLKKKFLIFILFFVSFFIFAIFGVKNRWGDTINHYFKGYDSIKWGRDISEGVEINLTHMENLNQDQKQGVEYTLKRRLERMGISDSDIYFDNVNNMVKVSMPASVYRPNFDFYDIAVDLSLMGNWKLTLGKEDPLQRLKMLYGMDIKKDSSQDEILATENDIKNANIVYSSGKKASITGNKNIPTMQFFMEHNIQDKLKQLKDEYLDASKEVKVLEEETKALDAQTKDLEDKIKNLQPQNSQDKDKDEDKESDEEQDENKENEENAKDKEETQNSELQNLQNELTSKKQELDEKNKKKQELNEKISKELNVFLDDNEVFTGKLSDAIDKDGNLQITNSKLSPSGALNVVNIVSSGKLPIKLAYNQINEISPKYGEDFKDTMLIFAGLLVFIAMVLIFIKYRTFGYVYIFNTIAYFSMMIACFTGFFSFLPGFCVNLPASIGVMFSFILGLSMYIYIFEKIKSQLAANSNIELCIKKVFSQNAKFIFRLNGVIILLAILLMGLFSPAVDIFSNIFSPIITLFGINAQNSIFSFAYALFVGSIANILLGYFVTKFVLKNLCGFMFFKKPLRSISKS